MWSKSDTNYSFLILVYSCYSSKEIPHTNIVSLCSSNVRRLQKNATIDTEGTKTPVLSAKLKLIYEMLYDNLTNCILSALMVHFFVY